MSDHQQIINISGISDGRVSYIAAGITEKRFGPALLVTSSSIKAKRLAEDLSFFSHKKIYVMPEDGEVFLRYEAKTHHDLLERLEILKAIVTREDCIIVSPVNAAIKKLVPKVVFENNAVHLKVGDELDLEELKRRLSAMGYERVPLVDAKGQFSQRGSIIDIFTPDSEYPYRFELFDVEIDSIRLFDLDTQRAVENIKSIQIYPAELLQNDGELFANATKKIEKSYTSYIKRLSHKEEKTDSDLKKIEQLEKRKSELLEYVTNSTNIQLLENYIHYFYEDTEYLWDYLEADQLIMVDDPDRVLEVVENKAKEAQVDFEVLLETGYAIPNDYKAFSNEKDYHKIYKQPLIYLFTPFQKRLKGGVECTELRSVISKQGPMFNGRLDLLETELKRFIQENYVVTIVCSTDERVENLKEFITRNGLLGKITIKKGSLTGGMEFPEEKSCFIWDGDIFTNQKRSRAGSKTSKSKGKAIQSFSDMHKGDFVVHENHGIGKFLGIEQLTVQNVKKDYLKIKYAGEDMLYVPVEQMDLIQKYISADGVTPKINKLSGVEWKKTKAKAKAAIANMAKELLELSAARQIEKGYAFSVDTEWQKEFEDNFPYEETSDQLRCIKEIKADMETSVAMDRLLCGDVGYGKTEVAARALFKCVADGKQAAVLVPTTLLANQHYFNMKSRFEKFPFKVEMLCRFRNDRQQDEIVSKLSRGSIDLVIGTHRMLSKDVSFKDLGLLVIDEEQRFGVQHKEAIKQLRKNVDVLTMSATPIPRTLHMSLVGIKDMSLIEEPPEERYPVQTYVLEQEDELIRNAIERELARNGQVYVIFNRVTGINKIASHISKLAPEARVEAAHGQMNERQLEDIMLRFMNNETNVLVATTIIESGIDIPNANTIIVLDADKLGLSQLYQLRGRVGRSTRMSYAYLMFQKDKVLSEVAEKRLRAIKEFTEFGAGFKVAMRDLEIRGAGNLLGLEQHGHMMMIGYELYCKLIDDAVRALGGEIVNPDREETLVELQVTAYIPDRYIADEVLKLQMYKKIAAIDDSEKEEEIIDELLDRFGEVPKETTNLIKISRIRSMAEKLCITRIHEDGNKIIFDFASENPLKAVAFARLVESYGMRIFIHGGVKPMVKYTLNKKNKLEETLEVLELMQGE
ncbi:transcription-repair coupling factor [Clostridium aminobutyricum]|uniref:Transcription-repair-coupling factor n=1 Tax=Clostridium aminobutyricum TaxID=33953 RepID=A0A939DA23_CLOAM|nr:transcription-repair coupling factor [Clostridium aminobutyricum]MBN7774169.1 transcription-repair coupling factor [Clostridium aminobutyricum]